MQIIHSFWGQGIDNNTSKATLNLQNFTGIDTVILQAGKIFFQSYIAIM